MDVRVSCTTCPVVLIAETDRLCDDDIIAVRGHCQSCHGIDLTTLPMRDLVTLVRIDVVC